MNASEPERYTESLLKGMTAGERRAVERYWDGATGIQDCFDLIEDHATQFTGTDNPSISQRIWFFKGLRAQLWTWREHLSDLKGEFWGESKTDNFTLFIQGEISAFEHAAWYFAQHALAELTGAPIIRRLESTPSSQPLPKILQDDDKPIRRFMQLDAWANYPRGDCFMVPDDDGDVLMGGSVREPQRSGTTVRIHIAAEADRQDVIRILRKQLAWYERGDIERDLLDDEPPF